MEVGHTVLIERLVMQPNESSAMSFQDLNILEYILSPFPFEIDCDNTANNIPNPAADDVSQVT
jgi:hypothetical protein